MSHDHPKEDKYGRDLIVASSVNTRKLEAPAIQASPEFYASLGAADALPDNNPKTQYGIKKPPLHLIPKPFLVILSMVMGLGAKKYGAYNWRSNKVAASVYQGAIERHVASWADGESVDPESGVSHLAHAAACIAILLDAEATGNLIDDRPPPGAAARLIKELTSE